MLPGTSLILLFVGVAAIRLKRLELPQSDFMSGTATEVPVCRPLSNGEVWATCGGRFVWRYGSGNNTSETIANCQYNVDRDAYGWGNCTANYKPVCKRWGSDVWVTCDDGRPMWYYTSTPGQDQVDTCNFAVDVFAFKGCAPLKGTYSPAPIKTNIRGYTYCLEHHGTDGHGFVHLAWCNDQKSQDWFWRGASLRNLDLGGAWCLDHTEPSSTWIIGRMMRCNGRTTQQWTTVEEYPDSQGSLVHTTFAISAKDRYFPLKPFLAGRLEDSPTLQWQRSGEIQVIGRWEWVRQIVGASVSFETCAGTRKSIAATTSTEWTRSVEVSMGLGFKALGSDASMNVPAALSRTFFESYTREFEAYQQTCANTTFQEGDNQNSLWQWVFDVKQSGFAPANLRDTTTRTGDYARTASRSQPPLCLPGLGEEGHMPAYQRCQEGAWLP